MYEVIKWADGKEWLVRNNGTKENPLYDAVGRVEKIVKRVRVYDELVEALKTLSEYIARHEKALPETQERDELAEDLIDLLDRIKGAV